MSRDPRPARTPRVIGLRLFARACSFGIDLRADGLRADGLRADGGHNSPRPESVEGPSKLSDASRSATLRQAQGEGSI